MGRYRHYIAELEKISEAFGSGRRCVRCDREVPERFDRCQKCGGRVQEEDSGAPGADTSDESSIAEHGSIDKLSARVPTPGDRTRALKAAGAGLFGLWMLPKAWKFGAPPPTRPHQKVAVDARALLESVRNARAVDYSNLARMGEVRRRAEPYLRPVSGFDGTRSRALPEPPRRVRFTDDPDVIIGAAATATRPQMARVRREANAYLDSQAQPWLRRARKLRTAVESVLSSRLVSPTSSEKMSRIFDMMDKNIRKKLLSQKLKKPGPMRSLVAVNVGDTPYSAQAVIDPGGVGRTSKKDLDALNAVLASHELHEAAVRPRNMLPLRKDGLAAWQLGWSDSPSSFYTHHNPDVLLQEHNALSSLSGEGADYARRVLRAARARSGESEHLRSILVEAFGPRAAQYLDEGRKVPKAMRRALHSKLREDPGIVDRTAPGILSAIRRYPSKLRHERAFRRLVEERSPKAKS